RPPGLHSREAHRTACCCPDTKTAARPGRRLRTVTGFPDRSALRELEAAAGLGLAVLLALNAARVAGEEAAGLQSRTQARLIGDQRAADAVTHRTCLAGETAALHAHHDVELAVAIGRDQRLAEDHAQHRTGEVDLLVLAVDRDAAEP